MIVNLIKNLELLKCKRNNFTLTVTDLDDIIKSLINR